MGRRVDVDQLVGVADLAERLGVRPARHVHRLRAEAGFPRPVIHVRGGGNGVFLWHWPDVERWARRAGRYPAAAEEDGPAGEHHLADVATDRR